jgi:hypothetical protein
MADESLIELGYQIVARSAFVETNLAPLEQLTLHEQVTLGIASGRERPDRPP